MSPVDRFIGAGVFMRCVYALALGVLVVFVGGPVYLLRRLRRGPRDGDVVDVVSDSRWIE